MRAAAAIFLAISLSAAGCASNSASKSNQPSASDAATGDVLEAVFRYQLEQNPSASRYCLELAGTSPDPAFVRRFEGNQPPVLSSAQCEVQPGKGIYLRLTKIQWITENEAWVRGATSDGGRSTPIVAYRVVREKGKWTIKAARTHGL
ncbi:MAG TPA: hypothetical protein VLV54_11345 [Thermoanaerobaculia bacterium]|nr:hypothetical protein [Thermoanaerobaculia bacterium]